MSRNVDNLPLNDPPDPDEFLIGYNELGSFRTPITGLASVISGGVTVPGSSPGNPADAFYLRIQGTGRVMKMWFILDGEIVRFTYEEVT